MSRVQVASHLKPIHVIPNHQPGFITDPNSYRLGREKEEARLRSIMEHEEAVKSITHDDAEARRLRQERLLASAGEEDNNSPVP